MSRTIPSQIMYRVLHKICVFAYAKITLFLPEHPFRLSRVIAYKKICSTFYLVLCKTSLYSTLLFQRYNY